MQEAGEYLSTLSTVVYCTIFLLCSPGPCSGVFISCRDWDDAQL